MRASLLLRPSCSARSGAPGTSISVTVAAGDVEACTITNVRK